MKRFAKAPWVFVWLGLAVCAGSVLAVPTIRQLILRARLRRVRSDYQRLWTATAAQGLDFCGRNYPSDTYVRRQSDPSLPLTFEWLQSFKRNDMVLWQYRTLTTPIAYISPLPQDPFNPGQGYGYAAIAVHETVSSMGILRSFGPDGKEDLNLSDLRDAITDRVDPRKRGWDRLTKEERGVFRQWIDPYQYDPTNGTTSRGDLVLVMEWNLLNYGFGMAGGSSAEWRDATAPAAPAPMTKRPAQTAEPRTAAAASASLTEDELKLVARVGVAAQLYHYFVQAGVLQEGKEGGINPDRVLQLRNHFGGFQGFFDSPKPIAAYPEKQVLEAWRAEDPSWWAMNANLCTTQTLNSQSGRAFIAYDIYPVLILYGKSQILKAAEEAGGGENETALRRLTTLRLVLQHVSGHYELAKADPSIARVHDELGRLCDVLEKDIKTAGQGK